MFKICYHNLNLALTLIVVVLAPLKLCESAVCLCHYLRQLVRQLAESFFYNLDFCFIILSEATPAGADLQSAPSSLLPTHTQADRFCGKRSE
jgi:hypothetical protein